MENEEYFCIDCAKQLECWGPDIKLDDPDLYIPINCIDYQEMDEFLIYNRLKMNTLDIRL